MAKTTGSWAIYVRISQDREGAGLGIERQTEDCRALGEKLGLEGDPTVYADNDISASSGKRRPAYERLMEALRAGQHRALVAWHTDRLHRRPIELEEFIAVAEANKVVTYTVKAGSLDLATPSGRMVARMLGAAARQEVEHKAERRARAIQQGAEQGKRHGGGRTFGYGWTDENGKAHDIEKINKREATAIRHACEAILRGESTRSIWTSWNAKGLTTQRGGTWNGSNFRRMISRPSLAGIATYKGEILDGVKTAWPAIVSEEQWKAVQAIITDPARRTSPGNTVKHLASGVTFCGAPVDGNGNPLRQDEIQRLTDAGKTPKSCGQPLRAGTNSIRSKRTGMPRAYTVYHCADARAGHVTVLKQVLDPVVRSAVIAEMFKGRGETPAATSESDRETLAVLEAELADTHAREARLAMAVSELGLSLDAAREALAGIKADRKRVSAGIAVITRRQASAGMDDAAWEELWAGIDPNALDEPGRWSAGRSLIRSMIREGMSEEEAKAKVELGRRFDALSLDRQRALVRSLVRITVQRGRASDRIKVEPL